MLRLRTSTNGLKTLVMIALVLLATNFAAMSPANATPSAARPLYMPASIFINEALRNAPRPSLYSQSQSAVSSKTPVKNAAWDLVPAIDEAELQTSFEFVRDEKIHTDSDKRARRATWLYPDDGCYVRAAVAVELAEKKTALKPAKIFAFGNLKVQTANSPAGQVGWWYHVAAIAKVTDPTSGLDRYFVYDPALQMKKPIEVQAWLNTMGDPSIEISICSGLTYGPDSDCTLGEAKPFDRAQNEVRWFLSDEWSRLQQLGRDPKLELGDFPPWL